MTIERATSKQGFTLVEVLVSITLFTAVAITGITAVLSAKSAYEKNRSLRAVTDSLMFVVEDVSRTARLGNYYHCISENAGSITLEDIEIPQGNEFGDFTCRGIAFEPFWNPELGADGEGDPEDQVIYVFATDTDGIGALYVRSRIDQQSQGTIQIDDNPIFNETFQRVSPQSLDIDLDRSGFDVFYDADNFDIQPYIIFRINGLISNRGQETELSLQTSISQRAIRVE
jgi:prepilin-type N-terminal cleavage/methylation domain-containing protein